MLFLNVLQGKISMNIRAFKKLFILFIACATFFVFSAQEAFAVRVSLKRIIFEGKTRSEVLTIINNTGESQTYRLGWRKYKMDERDALKPIEEGADDSGILWADNMLRFAPRRVTIPAGSSQQVRLLLRRPSDIQNAEYRSHLWIVTESKPEQFDLQANNNQQAIRLAVQPAISLPVFVRHGDLDVSANISDTRLTKTAKGLNIDFAINRDGDSSIYGDIDFVCNDNGTVLRQVRGISVYPEINKRYLSFNLPLENGPCNTVGIEYRADPKDKKFQGATLAKATASLN